MFLKSRILSKIKKIQKIHHLYPLIETWYQTKESPKELESYLSSFTFTESERVNIEGFLREAFAKNEFSFSTLCEKDKFLHLIRELFIKPHTQNILFYQKMKSILQPLFQIPHLIRNDDDLIRVMSIFFFYMVYSLFPQVSKKSKLFQSKDERALYQIQKIIELFIKIPNENYQFSMICYLLIDKYMDEEAFEKSVRKKFLYFCHHTFINKKCSVPSDEHDNADYIIFQTYFNAFVNKYNIETYDYLYDFMVYVFETLHHSSKKQSKEADVKTIYQETFSKSYITIYFFILLSNPSLKKHHREHMIENGKKAWLIQCLDDMCDIYQDMKNHIQTIYTHMIEAEERDHSHMIEAEERDHSHMIEAEERDHSHMIEAEERDHSRFETEMSHLFDKIFQYIYENTHDTHPLLCRTWIYIMMHIQVFLVYKNRKYVSEEYVKRYFQNKYYHLEMFESLKVDLFSSTQILLNLCKKWIEE